MILILLLILNNSSVGHTRAQLKSKPTAIPCQNNAILSVDYKLSIILGRRRPEQWRGWDGKVFTNKARWKYAYCIEGRQVEYKCGLLNQYLSMNFATWWCSTTLYNVLNDAFQAVIAFIVPISFKYVNITIDNVVWTVTGLTNLMYRFPWQQTSWQTGLTLFLIYLLQSQNKNKKLEQWPVRLNTAVYRHTGTTDHP